MSITQIKSAVLKKARREIKKVSPLANSGLIIVTFLFFSTALISQSNSAEKILLEDSNLKLMEIDFEGPVFEDHGYVIKDHSLIKDAEGLFHLFYIRGDTKSFGHATSPDLRHWTIQNQVIDTDQETWNSYFVWAPHVIRISEYPSKYLMYSTGVTRNITQKTHLAYSSDLFSWNKFSNELFEPFHGDTTWLEWTDGEWANYRDPFFFEDNGTNYIINSAETNQNHGTIALSSSDNYYHWADNGPLYLHDNWHMIESSTVIKHNDKYHLFFTEEEIGGISHLSSDSLKGEWDISTRTIIDAGHACELTEALSDKYIFSRHTGYLTSYGDKVSTIRFDTLSWNGNYPEIKQDKILAQRWTILWGTAFDKQPVYGNSYEYRGDDTTSINFEGNWWIGTYENFNGPIYGDYPGSIQGNSPRGAIKSDNFIVKGRSMRLLVGGGNYPDSCYIALCDAENDTIIYNETGKNTETMDERLWDLDPWLGRNVYLKIVDNSSISFGHINVDGIKELGSPLPTQPNPETNGPAPRGIDPNKDDDNNLYNAPAHPTYPQSINNYPNPFNPTTTIVIFGKPFSKSTITIYSVNGRKVRDIESKTNSTGKAQVIWDGCDKTGNPLSAGVYTAVLRNGKELSASTKLILLR